MYSIINSIISNKIFKFLIIFIILLVFIQVFVISYKLSAQSNPHGIYRDYSFIYKENYEFIKMLLTNPPFDKNIYYLNNSVSTAFKSNQPSCNTLVYDHDISKLYYMIRDYPAFEYCISFKLKSNIWLNYIIKPTIGVHRVVFFASLITLTIILCIVIFFWIFFKIILPINQFQNNAYKLGLTLVKKDIQPSGIKMLHGISKSINYYARQII